MSHSECSRGALTTEAELPTGRFRTRNGVLATRVSEGMILLDPATERYVTLNAVAAGMWERLAAGVLPVEIVNQLVVEYDAPREQIAADLRLQLQDLLAHRLIEAVEPPPKSVSLRVASHFRCAVLIAELRLRLAWQGYQRTLRWVGQCVEGVGVTDRVSMEAVRAIEYRVAMTAALYPGRAKCLERSLVLYRLLRGQGVAVRYCQGVQPYPFQAHAWVEYRDEVINDVPEHASFFARLPEQLP